MFEREKWECRFNYVPPMKSDAEYEAEIERKEKELEEIKEGESDAD